MSTQFAWHVHHDVLLEPLTESIEARQDYIREEKPPEEQEVRLRLLRLVRGELPVRFVEAGRTYVEARQARFEAKRNRWVYDDARQIYYITRQPREMMAYEEALRGWYEAVLVYDEACRAYESDINALHALECPNCPWDGKTIFPEERK